MEITLKTLHDDVQNLKGKVENLQDYVAEMRVSNTRWMVGLFIGGVVLFATIVGVYTGAVMVAMGS